MVKNLEISGGGYSPSQHRDLKIDLLKGMGILLMVFRHTEAPYSEFVLLFHMALFFIASGYLLDPSKIVSIKSLIDYVIKKIRGLWLPYFGFMTIFVVLHNLFLKIGFLTNNPMYLEEYTGRYAILSYPYNKIKILKELLKSAFFRGTEQLGGALWFFYALFLLTVGYSTIGFILDRIIKNRKYVNWIQGIISSLFLLIGYYLHIKGKKLYGFDRFFSFYCLLFIGQMMRGTLDKIYKAFRPMSVFLISLGCLLCLKPFGHIDLSANNIENPLYFLVVSIAGWFLICSLAIIMEEKQFRGTRVIAYLSVHSVPIVGLHFVSFKIVSGLCICVENMNTYMLAAFPVLMHGWWWIAYFISGIAIPLLLDEFYCRAKKEIKLLLKNS